MHVICSECKSEVDLDTLAETAATCPSCGQPLHISGRVATGNDTTVVSHPLCAAPSGDEPEAELPPALGRYRILSKLGSGGFGTVYKGYDQELRRDVAIKVFHRHRFASLKEGDAYLAEARVLASLDHPGIVAVYDVGRADDGVCYLVSKFVAGSDLGARIQQEKLSFEESARIVAHVGEALHHAHRRGLVHRDIKPTNILIDSQGNTYVADFGLAIREEESSWDLRLAGTPAYMSPEQARGETHRIDARTDIYSLGVVLYELLTGQRPFAAPSVPALLEQVATLEPRPPRQHNERIPRELDRICLKAISKRACDRFSTAIDLAEDLRHWQQSPSQRVARPPAVPPASPAEPPQPSHHATPVPRSDSWPIRVVPKGLRSFDMEDADFFLSLLPGPRDREGLPDSIRFWKTRIEETDPESTFSVGVIYGPSGCGKSSLVKAGLLPHLNEHVVPVYVEATPQNTETRLARQLRKCCAELSPKLSLPQMIASVRQGRGVVSGKKILLVLDQFEQWLHATRRDETNELVQALRQCAGDRIQCLILVRDDFWMATTRFMRDLEVRLIESGNSAAVDLFDARHARKVLTAFGQAFECLPANPEERTAEQDQFLRRVVEGLARDGRIIPVRLSLFVEMVKDKPWSPETLKQVGGTEGVGATFLEETFAASTAPPEHRLHQKAARRVLQALLPAPGTEMKGQMRAYGELLEISGYARAPAEFDQLIHILDAELRLITPTDPEGRAEPAAAAAQAVLADSPAARHYQLTHDYLVPSLRQWLTRKQRETRRGRAELRLAEQAAFWANQPLIRYLPSFPEWLAILFFTRGRDWTGPQRSMMRSATWLHALEVCGVLFLAAGLAWATMELGSFRASALVRTLASAEVADVPGILSDLSAHHRWANPLLVAMYQEAEPGSRRRLYASLALLRDDPAQLDYLSGQLPTLTPQELSLALSALTSYGAALKDRLWKTAEDSQNDSDKLLRVACALAAFDPQSSRWDKISEPLVAKLLSESPGGPDEWVELLRPARRALLRPLAELFRKPESPQQQSVAARMLSDYAADQVDLLAKLVVDADPKQFALLMATLQPHGAKAQPYLHQVLDQTLAPQWKDPAPDPSWVPPDPEVIQRVQAADGLFTDSFALCQTIPLSDLVAVAEALRPTGYRPLRLRPYRSGNDLRAACVWHRDGKSWQCATGLSAEAVRAQDTVWREQGYIPADVSGTVNPDGAENYAVVWVKDSQDAKILLDVGLSDMDYLERLQVLREAYMPLTLADHEVNGERRHSVIWMKAESAPSLAAYDFVRDQLWYESNVRTGALELDVRIREASKPLGTERFQLAWDLTGRILARNPSDQATQSQRASAAIALGKNQEAVDVLSALIDKNKTGADFYAVRAIAYARLGNHDAAKSDLAQYERLATDPTQTMLNQTLIYGIAGDDSGVERLEEALSQHKDDGLFLFRSAVTYSVLSDALAKEQPEKAEEYANRAVALVAQAYDGGYVNYDMQADWSLNLIRHYPAYREFERRWQPAWQYSAVWLIANAEKTSRELHGLAPKPHLERCRELAAQGYRPTSLSVAHGEEGERAASVWQLPLVPERDQDTLAKQQANAAVALLRLGEPDELWALLCERPDPRLRTVLIHRLSAVGIGAATLIARLDEEQEPSARQALILALGRYDDNSLPQPLRDSLVPRLQDLYRNDADPGVHSAAEWLLTRWDAGDELRAMSTELVSRGPPAGRRWFVNGQGHTMAVVPAGAEFRMGSPSSERDRQLAELPHLHRIGRAFAIATKETTVDQFRRFNDRLVQSLQATNPNSDGPMANVTWYEAAQYCRWLSEQEGVAESEMCYPAIDKIGPGMMLPSDYLSRTGYRLATEAEWELACRGGTTTSRHYGNNDDLLSDYAWYAANSGQQSHPVARLMPNRLGLFDCLGNTYEWCQDWSLASVTTVAGRVVEDRQTLHILPYAAIRGGSFIDAPKTVRSAYRGYQPQWFRNPVLGFRIARTLGTQELDPTGAQAASSDTAGASSPGGEGRDPHDEGPARRQPVPRVFARLSLAFTRCAPAQMLGLESSIAPIWQPR